MGRRKGVKPRVRLSDREETCHIFGPRCPVSQVLEGDGMKWTLPRRLHPPEDVRWLLHAGCQHLPRFLRLIQGVAMTSSGMREVTRGKALWTDAIKHGIAISTACLTPRPPIFTGSEDWSQASGERSQLRVFPNLSPWYLINQNSK